jgi:hypothetical protein
MKFDESVPIYDALGTILSDAQEFHRKISPLARPITRFVNISMTVFDTN